MLILRSYSLVFLTILFFRLIISGDYIMNESNDRKNKGTGAGTGTGSTTNQQRPFDKQQPGQPLQKPNERDPLRNPNKDKERK